MVKNEKAARPLDEERVQKAIVSALSPDLLSRAWRVKVNPETAAPEAGHCAVAAEAFYYLSGGKAAGLMPHVCSFELSESGDITCPDQISPALKATHWWVQGPKDGRRGRGVVYDPTTAQFRGPFPYHKGRGIGFQNPAQQPSKRARLVMDRVVKILGAAPLAAYKARQIAFFTDQQKKLPFRRPGIEEDVIAKGPDRLKGRPIRQTAFRFS